jgi:hypothetical protein
MARNLTTGLQRGLRRSIAGGLGANDLFSTAPLDLRFAQQKTLDPRVTFTRQSRATYVDGDGVIRTATTNLRTFSEDFANAAYSVSTRLTVTADAIVAPNGTTTADKLVATLNNDQKFVETTASIISSFSYAFGMFAKKGEYEVLQISVANTNFSGTLAYANFNLNTGTIVSSVDCTPSIQAIGDGWFRCSVIMAAATGTGANAFRFSPYASGNPGRLASYTGDGTSGIYLWGAQLEQSTTVGEYIPTTSTINSAPRFDHDPTTGESLGLLVEESRQNLLEYSKDISQWSSTIGGSPTITPNADTAPDGTNTATLIENTGVVAYIGDATSYTSGTTYTFSGYFKADDGDQVAILLYSAGGVSGFWNSETSNVATTFNLTNGTFTAFAGGVAPTTSTITDAGNGWWRCSITATATSNSNNPNQLIRNMSAATAGIYAWGYQIEAGSFPTSYIPTTGTPATRAADVASISGSNFSSWYRQDEGTVFAEAERPDASRSNTVAASITDGSGENRIEVRSSSTSNANARCEITALGLGQYSNATLASDTAYKKIALAYAADNVNSAANGNAGITDTVATIPVVSQLYIGNDIFLTDYRPGHVKRLTYWPQRLSNDTLQNITV